MAELFGAVPVGGHFMGRPPGAGTRHFLRGQFAERSCVMAAECGSLAASAYLEPTASSALRRHSGGNTCAAAESKKMNLAKLGRPTALS